MIRTVVDKDGPIGEVDEPRPSDAHAPVCPKCKVSEWTQPANDDLKALRCGSCGLTFTLNALFALAHGDPA